MGLKSLVVKYCYLDFLLLYFVNCTFCLFRYMCSFVYAGSNILNVNLFVLIYCSAHSSIMLPGANKHSANNSQQTRQHNPILCSIQLLKSPHRSFPAFSAIAQLNWSGLYHHLAHPIYKHISDDFRKGVLNEKYYVWTSSWLLHISWFHL